MYMHSLTHQLFIIIIICACMAVMTLDTSAVKKEASDGSGCIMITPAIFIMLQILLRAIMREAGSKQTLGNITWKNVVQIRC